MAPSLTPRKDPEEELEELEEDKEMELWRSEGGAEPL